MLTLREFIEKWLCLIPDVRGDVTKTITVPVQVPNEFTFVYDSRVLDITRGANNRF